jgi:hypothetical protein
MEVPFSLTCRGADHSAVPTLSNHIDCISVTFHRSPSLSSSEMFQEELATTSY